MMGVDMLQNVELGTEEVGRGEVGRGEIAGERGISG